MPSLPSSPHHWPLFFFLTVNTKSQPLLPHVTLTYHEGRPAEAQGGSARPAHCGRRRYGAGSGARSKAVGDGGNWGFTFKWSKGKIGKTAFDWTAKNRILTGFTGSMPVFTVFVRFSSYPVLWHNGTGHSTGSRLNRFDRPVRSGSANTGINTWGWAPSFITIKITWSWID